MEVNDSQSSRLLEGGYSEIRLVMPTEENSERLYEASKIGSVQNLKALIQEDPDIIEKVLIFSSNSETPLHISVLHGHLEFTRFLLDQKPELVVEIDALERTALHLASASGDIEIVRELLEKNMSPCLVRDSKGLIPLHHAVIAEKIEIVKELINARPQSVRTKLKDDQTVLHLCVEHNCVEAIEYLMELVIEDQVFFNTIDDHGNTILDLAFMLRRIEIIRYLLHVPGIKTGTNYTLDLAATPNNVLRIRRHKKSTHKLETQQTENRQEQEQEDQPDHQLSAANKQSCSCWNVLINYLKYRGDWLSEVQGTLMLVASVMATMSFQGIITPPGGVWEQDFHPQSNNGTAEILDRDKGGQNATIYKAGTSIMAAYKEKSYEFFLTVNTVSFFSSVSVILLIITGFPLRNRIGAWLLKLAMCAAVGFLSLSYMVAFLMVSFPKRSDVIDSSQHFKTLRFWILAFGFVIFGYLIRFLIWVMKILIWLLKRMLGNGGKIPTATTTT